MIAALAARERAWGRQLLDAGRGLGRVLEVGAGLGGVLRWALEAGAGQVVGLDVQEERATAAREMNPRTCYVVGDGRRLPFPGGRFDTVLCSMLFSSILDDTVAQEVAAEVRRVMRPDGWILWFDFFWRNPSNPDVRGVGAGHLRALFPGWTAQLSRAVLAPPLARRLVRLPTVSTLLEALPPLQTFYAGSLRQTDRQEHPG